MRYRVSMSFWRCGSHAASLVWSTHWAPPILLCRPQRAVGWWGKALQCGGDFYSASALYEDVVWRRLTDGFRDPCVIFFRIGRFILSKYWCHAFTGELNLNTSAVCWKPDKNGRPARGCHMPFWPPQQESCGEWISSWYFKNAVE